MKVVGLNRFGSTDLEERKITYRIILPKNQKLECIEK